MVQKIKLHPATGATDTVKCQYSPCRAVRFTYGSDDCSAGTWDLARCFDVDAFYGSGKQRGPCVADMNRSRPAGTLSRRRGFHESRSDDDCLLTARCTRSINFDVASAHPTSLSGLVSSPCSLLLLLLTLMLDFTTVAWRHYLQILSMCECQCHIHYHIHYLSIL